MYHEFTYGKLCEQYTHHEFTYGKLDSRKSKHYNKQFFKIKDQTAVEKRMDIQRM